jgi:hypothetical protein
LGSDWSVPGEGGKAGWGCKCQCVWCRLMSESFYFLWK